MMTRWSTGRVGQVVSCAGVLVLEHLAQAGEFLRPRHGSTFESDRAIYIGRGSSEATTSDLHWSNVYSRQHGRVAKEAADRGLALTYLLFTASPNLHLDYWLVPGSLVGDLLKKHGKLEGRHTHTLHIRESGAGELLEEENIAPLRHRVPLSSDQVKHLGVLFAQVEEVELGEHSATEPAPVSPATTAKAAPGVTIPADVRTAEAAVVVAAGEVLETMPLESVILSPEGVVCLRGTRVPLEAVVADFESGATPEETVQRFPAVALRDVYAVVASYLSRPPALLAYLKARQEHGQVNRQWVERTSSPLDLRERLLARRGG
jgi:uncharacterized protein (DUF433 family)